MENSFLSEFKQRDYFNQCTNSDELEHLMNKKKSEPILDLIVLLQVYMLEVYCK